MKCPRCECVFLLSASPKSNLYGGLKHPETEIGCPDCGLVGNPREVFKSIPFTSWQEGLRWFMESVRRQQDEWPPQ